MTGRTISLQLPEDLALAIERQARESGKDINAIITESLHQTLTLSLPPFNPAIDDALLRQVAVFEGWMATLLAKMAEFRQMGDLDELSLRRMENFEQALTQFLSVLSFTSPELMQEELAPEPGDLDSTLAHSQSIAVLDQILSASPELVFVQDRLGRFVYANSASASVFRITRSYFLGKTLNDLGLPQEAVETLTAKREEAFTSKHPATGEISFPAAHDVKDYEYIFSPVQNGEGYVDAVVFMARDVSERRHSQIALQQSEEMYRSLFDAASDSILISDLATGRILNANWSAARQLGYSRWELMQLSTDDIEKPMDQGRRDLITQKLELDGTILFEQVYRRKNRTEFPVEISAQVIEYEDRLAIQSFARDISDRKQAEAKIHTLNVELEQRVQERTAELQRINQELAREITVRQRVEQALQESEAKLNDILNSAIASIKSFRVFHTMDWEIDYYSTGSQVIYGYSAAELITDKHLWMSRILPEDLETVIMPGFENIFREEPTTIEYRFQHKDGTLRWISETITSRRTRTANCWIVTAVAIDITERKGIEAERQQNAERLRRSEGMLASAQRLSHVGSWELDLASQQFTWTQETFRIFGLNPSQPEPTLAELFQFIHPDDRERIQQQTVYAISNHLSYDREYRIIKPDGELRYVESRGELAFNAQGQAVKLYGAVLDITHRKRIEEALRQSEQRYRAVVEDQTELICRFQPDATILFANEAYCRYFGKPVEEVIGNSYNPEIFAADRQRVAQLVQTMSAENPVITIENRVVVSGEIRWTQWVNRSIFDEQGNFTEFQAVGRDITDLKQAETALREKEEQLRITLDLTQIGLWDWRIREDQLFWNENSALLLGLPTDQLQVDLLAWSDRLHPDDRLQVWEAVSQALETQTSFEAEYRVVWKDGSIHWILGKGHGIYDESGQPVRMVGVVFDISDRKQAEASLRESEERFQAFMSNTPALAFMEDGEGRLIYVNSRYQQHWGMDRAALLGKTMFDLLPVETARELWEHDFSVLTTGQPLETIETVADQNGVVRDWLVVKFPLSNTLGQKILGVVAIDITEQKRIEKELRDLTVALSNAVEGISRLDRHGRYIRINQAYASIVGYSPEEMVGMNWQTTVHPDDLPTMAAAYQQMVTHGKVEVEARGIRKQGSIFYKQLVMVAIYNEQQEFTGHHCFMKDISDRKGAEEALRQSEERCRLVVEAQTELVNRFLPDGTLTFVNQSYCQAFRKSQAELIGQNFIELMHPEEQDRLRIHLANFSPENSIQTIETRKARSDGEIRWFEWTDHAFFDKQGHVTEFQSVGRDITERKQAEIALHQSEERYRAIVEDQIELLSRSLPDGTLTFVNQAYCRTFGKSAEELIGQNLLQFEYEADQEALIQYFASFTPENPVQTSEDRIVLPDGTVRWYQWTDRASFDQQGNITEFQSVGRDVTERYEA
ncbi:PAS domain S-box protein [Kovacikia minuta CCNUW1]|uniref:PAS domain-containing protein n=1 Tax=Kovacikia minuta TaxID=2931930 RepID=UPI001CCA1A92|nr:PAS domain S-box protein [Kovacikia minuta]UBF25715.1 PAS domain S-box protein [Kovacikia minuta CCNUW1]